MDTTTFSGSNQTNVTSQILLRQKQEQKSSFRLFNMKLPPFHCDRGLLIKIVFTLVLGTFIIINGVYGFVMPRNPKVQCLDDKLMKLTDPLNDFFANNKPYKNALIITSSVCMDFVTITTALYWLFYTQSWRIIVTVLLFYGCRGIIQFIFQFSFPEGFIWEYPGFPSLVVNYDKTNDFFYSGHVGMPLIAALEWRKNGFTIPAIVCVFVSCLEGFTVFITRTHYSIDIIAGIVFAHYFYLISDWLFSTYIDKRFGLREKKEKKVGEMTSVVYDEAFDKVVSKELSESP